MYGASALTCFCGPTGFVDLCSNMSTRSEKLHRPWAPPVGYAEAVASLPSGVQLYNSLVDEKKVLVPSAGPSSRHLTWYSCGPTVYDSAHLGHSRNYVTFDILRRLLQDYFGYNVHAVMNVTDVDDKIIVRARRKHLLQQYRAEKPPLQQARQLGLDTVQVEANDHHPYLLLKEQMLKAGR